jgi:hypothetical protein
MTINFMTGFVMVLAFFVLDSLEDTKEAAKVLVEIFRFFPPYNVGEGLINMAVAYYRRVCELFFWMPSTRILNLFI